MKRIVTFGFWCALLLSSASALADDVDALLEKGIRAYSTGRKEAAYQYFKQAEAAGPTDPNVLSNLAKLTEVMQRYDEAVLYWTAYIHLHGERIAPALKEEAERALAKDAKAIPNKATLTVKVLPASANVRIRGTEVGKGNVTLTVQADKPYSVEAYLTDHEAPPATTLTLEKAESRTHTVQLKAITFFGTINLQIFPVDGVQVYLDAVPVGDASKPVQAPEGRRLICFKKPGYDRWWRYLEVRRDQSQVLKVDLREKSRADEPCDVLPPPDQR